MTIHCLIFEYHKFQSVFKCCLLNLRSQFGWNQTGRWILDRSESTFNARWHFCWSWMESYLYGIVARSSGSSSNGTMHALVRIIDLDVLFVRADTDPKLSRAWRVLAGSSVWGPLVLYIKPNGRPDLPVSRRGEDSELSVRSLLNQQLLVSSWFTNLPCAAPSVCLACPIVRVGRQFGFVYDVCHKFGEYSVWLARYESLIRVVVRWWVLYRRYLKLLTYY